jgi:hypothetical protein
VVGIPVIVSDMTPTAQDPRATAVRLECGGSTDIGAALMKRD